MIDQDLVAYLAALPDVGEKVYLGNAPQDKALPVVVVRRTGGAQPRSMRTPLFERSEFSINVITDNYAEVYPIANAIRDALKDYRDTMGTTVIHVSKCTLFPTDQTFIEGDKVTRWVAMAFSFMHA